MIYLVTRQWIERVCVTVSHPTSATIFAQCILVASQGCKIARNILEASQGSHDERASAYAYMYKSLSGAIHIEFNYIFLHDLGLNWTCVCVTSNIRNHLCSMYPCGFPRMQECQENPWGFPRKPWRNGIGSISPVSHQHLSNTSAVPLRLSNISAAS